MSIIIPQLKASDIKYEFQPKPTAAFENYASTVILESIKVFPKPSLYISNIVLVNKASASSVVDSYLSGQIWMNNEVGIGMGRCLGFPSIDHISNHLFFNVDLFHAMQSPNLNRNPNKPGILYVIDHELGHAFDHTTRGEIDSLSIIDHDEIFKISLIQNYYMYMVRGEMSACFLSQFAANPNLIQFQFEELSLSYETNKTIVLNDEPGKNDPNGRTNYFNSISGVVWGILSSFAKIIGYRLHNDKLLQIKLVFPPNIPSPFHSILLDYEKFVQIEWSYPTFTATFNSQTIETANKIAAVLGYSFVETPQGDVINITGI